METQIMRVELLRAVFRTALEVTCKTGTMVVQPTIIHRLKTSTISTKEDLALEEVD